MADYNEEEDGKRRFSPTVHPKRPLCACTSYSCNKLILFLYTAVYVLIGAALLIIGVWVEFQNKDFESMNKDLFIPAIIMMSVGFVIMIFSLIGVAGVLRENTCLLVVFLLVTFLAFLAQVSIGVLAFIYRQEVPNLTSDNLMFVIREYHDHPHYRTAVDSLQTSFGCCGFDSYKDYEENLLYRCAADSNQKCGVPWSCCVKDPEGQGLSVSCGYGVRVNSTMPIGRIYEVGCTARYLSWLSWHLDFVGIIGLGTAIPQVIGMLLAYFFIRQIREMKMWYRVGM